MRKPFLLALLLCCALAFSSFAQPGARDRIAAYFRAWYAYIPGSDVSVSPTREVVLPGLEAYKVERRSSSKSHQEENIAFYDAGRNEVFVGDLLHDPGRSAANRPFDPGRDLPNIEASMAELFGLPVKVELGSPARGALLPLTISIRQEKDSDSFVARTGFVSKDGSTLMLGEFQPLAEAPAAFRERLLGKTEGVRARQGRFTVTEFLDFQCDRCRVRTPDVRRAVAIAALARRRPLAWVDPLGLAEQLLPKGGGPSREWLKLPQHQGRAVFRDEAGPRDEGVAVLFLADRNRQRQERPALSRAELHLDRKPEELGHGGLDAGQVAAGIEGPVAGGAFRVV